ncbi:MAG: PHP domain-containing protein [Bacteroidales bacterium]|nr:PHP domain-containing protein [Candidatus Latescibacterota bacterium]
MPYVPLHVHSINSAYSGMFTPTEIISRAAFLGMDAVALTDKWTAIGHYEFANEAKIAGIKAIFGVEIRHLSLTGNSGTYHLTLLAENDRGYRNIIDLIQKHHEKEKLEYVTEQELVLHREGLIALTGCLKGETSQAVLHGNLPRERAVVDKLVTIYGSGNVFLEIMNHNVEKEQFIIEQFSILSRKMGVALVTTNNDRFALREDASAYSTLRKISGDTNEYDTEENHPEYFLKRKKELDPFFYGYSDALEESGRIAGRCEFDLLMEDRIEFSSDKDSEKTLAEMSDRRFLLAFHNRRKDEIAELRTMMQDEIKSAGREDLSGFILFLRKLLDGFRRRGVRLEIIGSEILDSLVAFLLDIIPLNPVEHGLLFESFNAPGKGVPPQLELIKPKGAREVFMLALKSMLPKSGVFNQVVREEMSLVTLVKTIMEHSDLADETSKAISEALSSVRKKDSLQDLLDNSDQLARMYNGNNEVRMILRGAESLRGRVHHFNLNTSRVVVLPEKMEDYLACITGSNGEEFCMVDSRAIKAIGGWTVVVQRSHFLAALDDTFHMLGFDGGGDDDGEKERSPSVGMPPTLDDTTTYEMISRGDTTGVYLLESRGIRDLLMKTQPMDFEGLVNVISLYRPAPLEGRLWQKYLENAGKKGKVLLPHHSLSGALESTSGLLLFKQQIREILKDSAGITGERAERIEIAVSKKEAGSLLGARLDFIRGAMEKEINEEDAQKIFDFLLHNTGFTYDRAFSCAQAYISYRTAWLKANHHDEYFAGLLNNTGDTKERQKSYLDYLAGINKEVFSPDINSSGLQYEIVPGGIRSPLNESGGLGDEQLAVILDERENNGPFGNLVDFMERLSHKLAMDSVNDLIDSGLFDFLMTTHSELKDVTLAFYEKHARAGDFFKHRQPSQKDRNSGSGQLSFFDDEPD